MSRDGAVLLRHARLCLERIASYSHAGKGQFLADTKTQDAILRNLEILGQLVRDFGVEGLEAVSPEVPWKRVAGLRNVLAHQYLGVDLQLVWNIVEHECPRLDAALERVLVATVGATKSSNPAPEGSGGES